MNIKDLRSIESEDRTLALESGIKTLIGEYKSRIELIERFADREIILPPVRGNYDLYKEFVKALEELLEWK